MRRGEDREKKKQKERDRQRETHRERERARGAKIRRVRRIERGRERERDRQSINKKNAVTFGLLETIFINIDINRRQYMRERRRDTGREDNKQRHK